jgi:hypothetical protein
MGAKGEGHHGSLRKARGQGAIDMNSKSMHYMLAIQRIGIIILGRQMAMR